MPATKANLLVTLRNFARFCQVFDERTEVPPLALLGPTAKRGVPHIFSASQIRFLMRRARYLRPWHSELRGITHETLIGLLACTGLRISEALRLRCKDVDSRAGTIHIAQAKYTPERDLPLHLSTVRALQRYLEIRRRHYPSGEHLFVGPWGRPLTQHTARYVFHRLARDLPVNGSRARPRLHDIRHSLATKLIAHWSKQSAPLDHRLLLLSRYLGHRHFHSTYWYIEPDKDALRVASTRFNQYRRQSTSEPSA
jgi:integrase